MYFSRLALATASLATVALVSADFILNSDDIPTQCQNVCDPVRELGDICDIDDGPLDDLTEDLIEAQCYCANESFNVNRITAQCASCLHEFRDAQNNRDDINDIMQSCGFSSTTYNEADVATVSGVVVQATRPTGADQLTTTITAAQNTPTGDGGRDGDRDGGRDGDRDDGRDGDRDRDRDGDGHRGAAPGFAPVGFGFGSLGVTIYVGVAAIAGAMLLQ
ncbi:hypothetical protein SODALDRAFT_321130 [Sodiomyces alkalinus F11]|uniref:Protein CAP22 n=1 Tax=Sodiomyces alkalinus (strain CBS 110278 / VKM F-3762 / F11) TaxID=1314773 RepID=A0A3N2PKL5_SODAK|nr:hypothetical protein SODALDRAFT_321130 [Sodiomyces alkalinus F11]ROT35055.1 hypothetical protein SODALDRAFT_321130 [Sodiomyces alkalinus F11]